MSWYFFFLVCLFLFLCAMVRLGFKRLFTFSCDGRRSGGHRLAHRDDARSVLPGFFTPQASVRCRSIVVVFFSQINSGGKILIWEYRKIILLQDLLWQYHQSVIVNARMWRQDSAAVDGWRWDYSLSLLWKPQMLKRKKKMISKDILDELLSTLLYIYMPPI